MVVQFMSIAHIRWVQRVLQVGLLVLAATRVGGVFVPRLTYVLDFLPTIAIANGLLWLFVRRVRCPVCHYVFVGKDHPHLFTDNCRNCGRRSGDFS